MCHLNLCLFQINGVTSRVVWHHNMPTSILTSVGSERETLGWKSPWFCYLKANATRLKTIKVSTCEQWILIAKAGKPERQTLENTWGQNYKYVKNYLTDGSSSKLVLEVIRTSVSWVFSDDDYTAVVCTARDPGCKSVFRCYIREGWFGELYLILCIMYRHN